MVIERDFEIVREIGGGGEVNQKGTQIVYSWLFVDYLRIVYLEIIGFGLVGEDWSLLQQHIINSGCKAITNGVIVMKLNVDGGRNGGAKLVLGSLQTTVELVGTAWCDLLDVVNK